MSPSPYNSPPSHPPIAEPVPSYSTPYGAPPSSTALGDGTGGIIPYKNPQALLAYYIGLFSLLPILGLVMGPAAVVLGVLGLKYAKKHPIVKGQVHAWVGIVCGGFWTIAYWGLMAMMFVAFLTR